MILAATLAAAAIILGNLALVWVIYCRYSALKRQIMRTLRQYFDPADANTQSPFADLIDQIADRLGKKTANSLKATFLGEQSVDARNVKRLETDLVTDMASQQNPLLGLAMKQFPSFGKRLMKNPDLIEAGLKLLGGMGGMPVKAQGGDDGKNEIISWEKYG